MGLFNQKKDTVEWIEYRPDVLFYKWKNREIKKGSRLVIRAGQKAIFYSGGRIHGIFENEGTYDIDTQIIPFLTHINAALHLRSDTGERAEVYFVNSKDLTLNWGTTQRIMIPTPEVPSGIPVGMNGNMVIYFRDYLAFISKVAGIRDTYSLSDVSERIRGEMSGIVAESILNGERAVGLNVLVGLQANNRTLGKKMAEELDKELFDIGLGVRDVNIISVSYPPEVEKMAEKVAAQSFITDTNKYVFAAVGSVDGLRHADGGEVAIALIGEHQGIGIGAFHAGGHGAGAAMGRGGGIVGDIIHVQTTAADAENAGSAINKVHLIQHFADELDNSAVHTAGAETGNFILLNGFCPRINLFHSFPSFTYSAAFLLLLLRPHGS